MLAQKSGYGTNDTRNDEVKNYKNELFTGNLSNWKSKLNISHYLNQSWTNIYLWNSIASEEERTDTSR